MRPRRPVPLYLAIAALTGALAGSACSGEPTHVEAARAVEPEAVEVPALRASVADLSQTLTIAGSLTPQARVAVASKLPGRLDRITVDIGDQVRAGQVIALIDAREIDAQVDAAKAAVNVARAALASAEAALSNAVLEHDRATKLFERGALPRQRLDGAETAHRAAVAQRDLAQANLAQAEAALRRASEVRRDATITAPMSGVVVERHVDPGALVGPGDRPLVVVADSRVLKLEAGVSELEAGRLRLGMPAQLAVQARPGVTYDGRLAAMAPEIDAKNRHFQVEVRVDNHDGTLLSGMYATAAIEVATAEDAVIVPKEVVATRDGARTVLRVTDGVVQPVRVVEGIADATRVQIVSGVSSGDVLVADGRRSLPAGTRVKPVTKTN